MKKILLILFAVSFYNSGAQLIYSRDGQPVLPERGDWSIGVDATRLARLKGFNFLSGSNAIILKYMKDSVTAYRAGVRIGVNNYVSRQMVTDRLANANPVQTYPAAFPMKENVWKRTSTIVGLSAGLEKRRGKTRLQGIYGFEGAIYFSGSTDKFTYANALNPSPLNPVTVDARDDAMYSQQLGNANNVDTVPRIQAVKGFARVTERKNGLAFSIGVRGFIGAEYFFLPKMSVGGEFGWGLGFTTTGRSETTYESEGQSSTQGIKQTTFDGNTESVFSFDTDNNNAVGGMSASLRLNLYF